MLLKEPKAFEALVFTKVANGSEEDVEEPRPFRGVINIGECVQVGQLSEETFQAILKGCIAPGVNMEKEHVNKREQIYSFIDIFPCFFKREGDKRLIQCMALSRLVFPTSLSTDFYCYIETEGARQNIYPRNSGLGCYWIRKFDSYLQRLFQEAVCRSDSTTVPGCWIWQSPRKRR